jgi:hypothetical protein
VQTSHKAAVNQAVGMNSIIISERPAKKIINPHFKALNLLSAVVLLKNSLGVIIHKSFFNHLLFKDIVGHHFGKK